MSQREKLEAKTAAQLRIEARQAGHEGVSSLRKAELVDLLLSRPEPGTPSTRRQTEQATSAIGRVLQLVAVVGLFIGVAVALLAPVAAIRGSQRLGVALRGAAGTAEDLAETVRSSERSLASAASAMGAARQTLISAGGSLEGADPLLASVGDLLAEDLPTTIETTRASLASAEQGAAAMDRVLHGLRLFGLEYDPDQPLSQSFADTAASLEPLPAALGDVEEDLADTRTDLKDVSVELRLLAGELDGLAVNLDTMADELGQQATRLDQAAGVLERWANRMRWLGWVAAAAAALFGVWLSFLHLTMFEVGRRWQPGKGISERPAG